MIVDMFGPYYGSIIIFRGEFKLAEEEDDILNANMTKLQHFGPGAPRTNTVSLVKPYLITLRLCS